MSDGWLLTFGIIAGVIRVIFTIPNVIRIYQGRTKPHRGTWLIWFVLNLIFFFTQLSEGASYSIIFLGVSIAYQFIELPKIPSVGVGGFSLKDRISLVAAAFGLFLWWLTNEPLTALMISLGIDIIGSWLAIEKTYRLPWSETLITWQAGIVSSFFAILSVGELDFELLIFPVYILVVGIILVWTMMTRRKKVPRPY